MQTLNGRGLTMFALTLLTLLAVATGTAAAAPAAPPPAAAESAPPAAEFPELGRGSRGDVVRIAQRLLTHDGYPATPDGVFGPRTERRTWEFQTDRGLRATGQLDVVTWEWLVTEVGRGDRGEPVRVLQWLLGFHGHPVAVDGAFGPKTESATRAFQRRSQLPETGIADVETWRVLVGTVTA